MSLRVHHLDCGTLCPGAAHWLPGLPLSPPRMVCHCLLIESSQGLVLVETGIGLDDMGIRSRSFARTTRRSSTRLPVPATPNELDFALCATNRVLRRQREAVEAALVQAVTEQHADRRLIGKRFHAEVLERQPRMIARMQRHADEGARIIDRLGFLQDAVPAIRHHHERFDGKGYPDGLAGEEIPLGARIIHVADALDSMLTTRIYRAARPVEEAVSELREGASTQFCPRCVGALERLVEGDGLAGYGIRVRVLATAS